MSAPSPDTSARRMRHGPAATSQSFRVPNRGLVRRLHVSWARLRHRGPRKDSGMARRAYCGQAGFTLVEVMIALFIFGLLAAAGVALLSFSVRAQTATATRLDDVAAFNRLTSSLAADLAQALPRRARGEGGEEQPAFFGATGSGTAPMLRLVRGGWSNVDEAPRASVQKVDYVFGDNAVARVAYPMVDGAAPLPASPILTHVRSVAFRYRYAGAWTDHWDGSSAAVMPQALEMMLVHEDGKTFRALFLVGPDQVNHAAG